MKFPLCPSCCLIWAVPLLALAGCGPLARTGSRNSGVDRGQDRSSAMSALSASVLDRLALSETEALENPGLIEERDESLALRPPLYWYVRTELLVRSASRSASREDKSVPDAYVQAVGAALAGLTHSACGSLFDTTCAQLTALYRTALSSAASALEREDSSEPGILKRSEWEVVDSSATAEPAHSADHALPGIGVPVTACRSSGDEVSGVRSERCTPAAFALIFSGPSVDRPGRARLLLVDTNARNTIKVFGRELPLSFNPREALRVLATRTAEGKLGILGNSGIGKAPILVTGSAGTLEKEAFPIISSLLSSAEYRDRLQFFVYRLPTPAPAGTGDLSLVLKQLRALNQSAVPAILIAFGDESMAPLTATSLSSEAGIGRVLAMAPSVDPARLTAGDLKWFKAARSRRIEITLISRPAPRRALRAISETLTAHLNESLPSESDTGDAHADEFSDAEEDPFELPLSPVL